MVKEWKNNIKNSFSSRPTIKTTLGVITALIIVVAVTIMSIRKSITIDIDGKEETFITYKWTVEDVLEEKGVTLNEKDKISLDLEEKISNETIISIKRAVEVSLVVDNKTITINTAEETIEDMLIAEKDLLIGEGIEFNKELDEITPELDSKIEKNLNVEIVKVEILNEVALEEINFDTVLQEDSELDYGLEEVKQVGALGEKEITYKIVKKNGKEFSKDVVSSKVTKEPINEIIAEGTRKVFASRNGYEEYQELIYCESTAYYTGWITATGTTPVYNPSGISTIAVDPRVIPLGSLVYVDGYGYAVAADTGGAIKGNIVDVFVNSYDMAMSWGRKYSVPVYIISYPGEW